MKSTPLVLAALVCVLGLRSASAAPVPDAKTTDFNEALRTPTRTLVPELKAMNADDEATLISLLDDKDPKVRARAAKAVVRYVETAEPSLLVINKLLEVIDRKKDGQPEPKSVRREAIKSLYWAARANVAVKAKLLAIAQDAAESESLRAITIKSLYGMAQQDDVRDFLQRTLAAGNPASMREAAAWALWNDVRNAQNGSTREALLKVASDKNESESPRLEATKSLFFAMNLDGDVRKGMQDIAADDAAPESVREAALRAFLIINHEDSVKAYLKDLAEHGSSSRLRSAATDALGPMTYDLFKYFHLSIYHRWFINPLADQ